jgi:O-antigen/teichoic acid export membrane protein
VTVRSSCHALFRSFGSGLLIQAILSASNFFVGWMLIRRTSDVQYGYYVLVFTTILLLTALQGSFIQPQMVVRMVRLDGAGRADLIGGLLREQRVLLRFAAAGIMITVIMLWLARLLDTGQSLLIVCATLAAAATLMREYFRMVLFACRRPQDVLWADACYVAFLLSGVLLATYSSVAAIFATLSMAFAAGASTMLLSKAASKSRPWNPQGAHGILRAFAPLGAWSLAGAGAHWALSQSYSFVTAGVLSLQSVAAIAATRLLLMPLNLVSAGLNTQLFPLTADWVHRLGVLAALRRLALVSVGLVGLALCYFALVWLLRDWIFTELLHKQFPQRDALLLLWSGAFVLMLVRDQLVKLLAACERFPVLASVTAVSAVLSLAFGYGAMLRFGEVGAVAGIAIGELANIVGIVILTVRELKRAVPAPT